MQLPKSKSFTKHSRKHHYYICSTKKKKLCTKRAVRQDWIEPLVLKYLLKLVKNEELLEFIAENTYQYFLAQNTDTTYTQSLQKALDETEKSIANLLKAIEAGIFNESTKERMNELEEQKKDLRVALVWFDVLFQFLRLHIRRSFCNCSWHLARLYEIESTRLSKPIRTTEPYLFNIIASTVLSYIPYIGPVASLGLIIPGIALSVRRLHDTGKPWTYLLMILIPIAGPIILIVRYCKKSDVDNQWGPAPKN